MDCGVACCSGGGAARCGVVSEVPLLENVERNAVAAVLRGGFSLPLPRLLHRTARRGFSLVVGERERGSAGARGRCPSRRPTLSKPTRSSTHSRRFYRPSLGTTAVTNVSCSRAYTRGHTHAAHTRTNDASSSRRRMHAARRRRGRRRRARLSDRTEETQETGGAHRRIWTSRERDGSKWW